jgi:hypothetical protein
MEKIGKANDPSLKAGLKSETKTKILKRIGELEALEARCNDSLSFRQNKELSKIIDWLQDQENNLERIQIKPQLRSIKQPSSRSSIDTLFDNLFEFSKFTSTLPDALLKKINNFATPKPQKQTPAQIRTEIDEGQHQEIARRKSQATMKPANENKTINFGFGAIALPNFSPVIPR